MVRERQCSLSHLGILSDILEKKLESGYPVWWEWAGHYQFTFHRTPEYCLLSGDDEIRQTTFMLEKAKQELSVMSIVRSSD
jgi:hypothetical protein